MARLSADIIDLGSGSESENEGGLHDASDGASKVRRCEFHTYARCDWPHQFNIAKFGRGATAGSQLLPPSTESLSKRSSSDANLYEHNDKLKVKKLSPTDDKENNPPEAMISAASKLGNGASTFDESRACKKRLSTTSKVWSSSSVMDNPTTLKSFYKSLDRSRLKKLCAVRQCKHINIAYDSERTFIG